jgi:hypothetical protein
MAVQPIQEEPGLHSYIKTGKKLGRLCWHVPHDGFAGRQWGLGYHRAHRPGELSGCPMVLAGCLP